MGKQVIAKTQTRVTITGNMSTQVSCGLRGREHECPHAHSVHSGGYMYPHSICSPSGISADHLPFSAQLPFPFEYDMKADHNAMRGLLIDVHLKPLKNSVSVHSLRNHP